MKTEKITNEKSLLTELRSIRDKISSELAGMTPEQIVEHLKTKKTLHPAQYYEQMGLAGRS